MNFKKGEGKAMADYRDCEKECERIQQENSQLLKEFDLWLQGKRLTEGTIRRHLRNIDFYINHFLLYEEAIEAKNGASEIYGFLGDWFIRKALWSSAPQIKNNAASLKKFYRFMCDKGLTKQEDLDDMNDAIKEFMPDWLAQMRRFDAVSARYNF